MAFYEYFSSELKLCSFIPKEKVINHLYNKHLKKCLWILVILSCITAQREESACLKSSVGKKNSTSPHAYLNCFENLMTHAVFPDHPIPRDMVTIDTFWKVVALENYVNICKVYCISCKFRQLRIWKWQIHGFMLSFVLSCTSNKLEKQIVIILY